MLKKLVCLFAILGMVSAAYASNDWDGGGDGTTWSDGNNWDDPENVPPQAGETWTVNKSSGATWNILVDQSPAWTIGGGSINPSNLSGSYVDLTVPTGVTLTSSGGLDFKSAGTLTIEDGATYDMRYGQLTIERADTITIIEADGEMLVSTLRHDNGTKLHVYGDLWIWTISRIAVDPGWLFNVYDGGKVTVAGVVPYTVWAEGDPGVIGMYIGSTVEMTGNHLADFRNKVVAKEGVLTAEIVGGYTVVTCVAEIPEPVCNTDLPSDADGDGDVDQDDFAQFQVCYSGTDTYPTSPENCGCFDVNTSGTIDAVDFAAFTACATGPGIPVNGTTAPGCAALMAGSWEANDGALGHLCGSLLDTDDWRCVPADLGENTECFMSYGPYIVLDAGEYTARLYLRIDDIAGDDDNIVAVDVYSPQGGILAGPFTYTRSDFVAADAWQRFDVNFTNPGSGFKAEFRVVYYGNAQLDLDKVELLKVSGISGQPGTPYVVSGFNGGLDSWTASTWVAGTSGPGTTTWISTIGNPPGSVKALGAGTTNGSDGCTREGSIIQKAIDTSGKSNLWLHYDANFACRLRWTGYPGCTACSSNWLEGDCDDKLVAYCSTDGGTTWTLLEQIYAVDVNGGVYLPRQIKLPAAANNNANFVLKFQTQVNTVDDVIYVDNIGLSEGTE